MSQDMTFFDERMQGEIVGRLTQDVSEFKHTFKLVITQGLKCTSQIVGSVISLFTLSPSLTFTLASSMPALYIFMNFYGIFLRQLSKKAREIDSDASSVASEAISNIRTVRAFVAEDTELQRYTDAADKSGKLNTHLGFHIGLFQGLTNTSIGCMILVILYSGGRLVMEGKMTGGQLMAFMVSTQNTQKSMALVGVLFGQVIKAMGTASRVFEYIHLQPTIPTRGGIIPSTFKGMVEFQNYPSRPDHTILHNFSLTVPAGTMVALCGQSGSGKSTVGQLLERFYDIDHGRILIDGVNIQEIDPSWLRSHIGYINQEPNLFATSIMENIRYGRPDATDAEVFQAAKDANATEFISRFPDKYDTIVGERGATLSGGQKQRIAIARALLKDPQLLILDEATSALDTQSEKLVQQALDRLMEGRTVLVIAHRLSTIQHADKIVVMDGKGIDSNVIESGSHDELMKHGGVYFKLYQQLS
ncbi:ATP-binding cassette, sub-B (MDR TAP), member 8 [Globomyces sp. JEL0801]|nr:ATP-binding cassette, sub-B (MDR TAP), member 8 [Globomyces sp. JEL0801]